MLNIKFDANIFVSNWKLLTPEHQIKLWVDKNIILPIGIQCPYSFDENGKEYEDCPIANCSQYCGVVTDKDCIINELRIKIKNT